MLITMSVNKLFILLILILCCSCTQNGCSSAYNQPPARDASTDSDLSTTLATQPTRLRIISACNQPMWIFWQSGHNGGTMPIPHRQLLTPQNPYIDYPIPNEGIAGTRFWPGMGCDENGNNCTIGQSGGPADQGFSCPPWGCAPPIDSKFEGTFGCLPSIPQDQCLVNPSDPQGRRLPNTDGWDTSNVDGFTLPYSVRVNGNCSRGPQNNRIDCSSLSVNSCPAMEDLSNGDQFPPLRYTDLRLFAPIDGGHSLAGCYSDCGRLTYNQWGGMNYRPNDPQAQMFCCPTPPISPAACSAGPVANTEYTQLIHQQCPQVYAYAYDDGTGNWTCDAGTKYTVTFYCPR